MKTLDKATGVEGDPDWSCFGKHSSTNLDPRSSTRPIDLQLLSLTPEILAGVTVDVFLDASTLGRPHATRVFDPTMPVVRVDVPIGQTSLSLRVRGLERDNPQFSVAELREYGVPIDSASASALGFMLLTSQRALIENLALPGGQADPSKGFLIAYARDCRGQDVSGAQFQLLDGRTGGVVRTGDGPGLPHESYSQNALPNPECTFTSYDQAGWVLLDAPLSRVDGAPADRYRLRVLGRMRASDTQPVVLGEAELELVAGAISFVHIVPTGRRE